MRFPTRLLAVAASAALLANPALALQTSQGDLQVAPVVKGVDDAWGLAFLPDGGFLFTLKRGQLRHVGPDGTMVTVEGVPAVETQGQGGLLDVMLPRDFAETREVFLSFSKSQAQGSGTALAAGTLSDDGSRLEDVRILFEMSPGSSGGRHFGSRIVEGPDGHIFLTMGDRGNGDTAQDTSRHNGSIVRLNRDGSVPADNPFAGGGGGQPEIWSYGHRNPQGATLDLSGQLWAIEHGAQGGDEVNRIEKGANYGWPVISYGKNYNGTRIGEGTSKPGMEQPEFYWDPSIAPSGAMVYSGKLWPEWRGDMFVGSLKFDYIARLDGDPLNEVEQIKGPETGRIRDIREAPDGTIWFISEGSATIYRMAPR